MAVPASRTLCDPLRSEPGMIRILIGLMPDEPISFEPMNQIASIARIQLASLAIAPEAQPLRYTQTRAGGRFIQIRSDASVDTPGKDFGIGGVTE